MQDCELAGAGRQTESSLSLDVGNNGKLSLAGKVQHFHTQNLFALYVFIFFIFHYFLF